jgi:hypothetical protein
MVRRLRQGAGHNGLILANGGFLSYQHAICISTQPRGNTDTYPDSRLLQFEPSNPIPPIVSEAEGEARIEVSDSSEFHYTRASCPC